MQAAKVEYEQFHSHLRSQLFDQPTLAEVHELLRRWRFVVLQGPPGTGKTRMAQEILLQFFHGRGMTVQFHPAVTYEDFVIGLSPDAQDRVLRFSVESRRKSSAGASAIALTRSLTTTWPAAGNAAIRCASDLTKPVYVDYPL